MEGVLYVKQVARSLAVFEDQILYYICIGINELWKGRVQKDDETNEVDNI